MSLIINKISAFFKFLWNGLKNLSLPWFIVFYAVTIYFSTILNYQILNHFYRILEKSEGVTKAFLVTPPIVLLSLFTIIILPFCFKYVFKIVFSILILLSASFGYFSYKYGIIFDYDMMINILETNPSEAKSYLNSELFLDIFLFGVIPSFLILFIKIKWPKTILRGILGRGLILLGAFLTLFILGSFYYQNYASICRNNHMLRKEINPHNFIYNGYKAIRDTYFPEKIEFTPIGTDSIIDNKDERPEIFVILLGETARAQNFDFNGYNRNTTPYTKNVKNLVNFISVSSCGTATAVSVPCLFSILKRSDYDEKIAKHQSSMADILKYSGYDVSWFDNDGGCKGVCERIPNEELNVKDVTIKDLCDSDSCYDEALLRKLKPKVIEASKSNKHTVIFLHLIGSHGPTYHKRLPDNMKVFKPSCERSDIENCSVEEIVNAYDNTLVYTDYIVKSVVDMLEPYSKDHGVGLLYVSDHGESLGEFGLFLHGAPYALAPDFQKKVPMMTYFSDSFAFDHDLDLKCLRNNAETINYSHDNVFHSVLGILDVNTSFYDKSLDIFAPCRNRDN
ncbi:MAG: phosphoethanolamine--lipid A transferase [Succinivibrionaceae bacterium]|nr:phosphoethanolamine--lipid A transferase [Succinivibrionaceae bacterium]